ncbi:MAG: radical SAM family heme chaperone HemW [Cytophagaceae bacterium]|jgi:oxygen-independent coproporphyrinogen-3 oxidase|nr:radical SAM family heme chaperone HemW [Cytophagaceae bacterium]
MASIYFHIPYCRQACHYCDFHFSTNTSTQARVVAAMRKELELRRAYIGKDTIQTIYFGGGTPSVLHQEELSSLLEDCFRYFSVSPGAEITLEANPDDVSLPVLRDWKALGVNRISLGVQTFQSQPLRQMNRIHTGDSARRAIQEVQEILPNITVDLMYGLVGDTLDRLKEDTEALIQLNIPHLSAYCLTIEEKTAFGQWHKKGKLETPEEDISVAQFDYLMDVLESQGYLHYEISNFGKPGYLSQHNRNYWQGGNYLGIGPGAHSYNQQSRQYNVENNVSYFTCIEKSETFYEIEYLDEKIKLNEYLLTGIRTMEGIDLEYIRATYPQYWGELSAPLPILLTNGLVLQKESRILLTRKGKHLSDRITRDLFIS